jgi:hypothetical protein
MAIRLFILAIIMSQPLAARAADRPDYLATVRGYIDAMLEHGRDTYGSKDSPLFASVLDRTTLKLLEGEDLARVERIPRSDWGIRPHDRVLEGANPMHDQNLYQVMYGLTKLTGDRRYADEADETLKWFFENCQSSETGLMAWGEHLGWGFRVEAPHSGLIKQNKGALHEFYRPWALWEHCFKLAPAACQRFAEGLWQHQIADHDNGLFSRHAFYDQHKPATGAEFPRHGGFYIATWAAAYQHRPDPLFLEAITSLVDGFNKRRHPQTDILPAYTNSMETCWPPSNLSLAIDLWNCAPGLPNEVAKKLKNCAKRTDKVFLQLPHDLKPGGAGFVTEAVTSTGEPGSARGRDRLFTQPWTLEYGAYTDATIGMLCYLRHGQIDSPDYRKLFLAAADRYLNSEPDTSIALYPGALGDAITLLTRAYRTTNDKKYLKRADQLADRAVTVFFDAGPLPRASSRHDHYEAITRADTLAMALLDLWAIHNKPGIDLGLIWSDR